MTEQEARTEAERRYPNDRYEGHLLPGAIRNARREAFQEGAAWQRARRVSPVTREDALDMVTSGVLGGWNEHHCIENQGCIVCAGTRAVNVLYPLLSVSPPAKVEWEYGLGEPFDAVPRMTGSESLVVRMQKIHGGEIFKRTAPGQWVPVKGTK